MRSLILLLACLSSALAQDGSSRDAPGNLPFPAYEPVVFSRLRVLQRHDPLCTEQALEAGCEGSVILYAEVSRRGLAERIRVLHGIGYGLDEQAVEATHQWAFEPAIRNGSAVAAGTVVSVDFQLPGEKTRSAGAQFPEMFTVGADVEPPKVLSRVEPQYTEAALRAHIKGIIFLYAEVTTQGDLRNVQALQGLGMGMDELAVERISQWKFAPARRQGTPVSVWTTIELNFNPA